MAYSFRSVTVRTDNSEKGMAKINELWTDVLQGKVPLDFIENGVPVKGLFPISMYSEYESDERGKFDLTIASVDVEFFGRLEQSVREGKYLKIDESGATISDCANQAWAKVWALQTNGTIKRRFSIDYESTVPKEYSEDGQAHCCLYIAIV